MDLKGSPHTVGSIFPASLFLTALIVLSGIFAQPSLTEAAGATSAFLEQPKQISVAPRANLTVVTLESLSLSAEGIFNLALAGKIDLARKNLDILKKTAAVVGITQSKEALILWPRLERTIADLGKAIATKDRLGTMRQANRITLIAATLAVPFKPDFLTELSFLDYNDRELGIWSEVSIMDKLSSIVIRMHLAWQTLMPMLIEHHGEKELRRFSEIMERLELAKSPEEYGRLFRLVLAESDVMRAILAKPATGVKSISSIHLSESIAPRKPLIRRQGGAEPTENRSSTN